MISLAPVTFYMKLSLPSARQDKKKKENKPPNKPHETFLAGIFYDGQQAFNFCIPVRDPASQWNQ